MKLTYDDVLIVPGFSEIDSRADVDISSFGLNIPVISANMDTVTEYVMAKAMSVNGGVGALHRFASTNDNVIMFLKSPKETYCSIGVGDKERERARALAHAGCYKFILDVAHGAQRQVVNQVKWLADTYDVELIVGNFASPKSIEAFQKEIKGYNNISAYKIGIGPGAACTTRIKTGVGYPQLSAVMDCSKVAPVIADGGIKTPGDVAKALAAGAQAVMVGKLLAATYEAPGPIYEDALNHKKLYRGSASQESYNAQGKNADWITAEGASGILSITGSVKDVMADIAGGLRSALTYVGARSITEFREKVEFIQVSSNVVIENGSRL